MLLLQLIDIVNDEPKGPCKGIFYRGYRSTFYNGYKLESRMGIRFLKSLSCDGCQSCGYFEEELTERTDNIIGLDEVSHGKLYTLKVTNQMYDWESGICDSLDIEIVEADECQKIKNK